MEKLKLNSRLKKVFISLFLVLVCFVGLCGIGLKANASSYDDNGIQISPDSDTCVVFFNIPYNLSDTSVIKDNLNDNILTANYSGNSYNFNGNEYALYYANGDTSKPLYSNRLYAFAFENGIDRYRFYEISFDRTMSAANGYFSFTVSDIDIVELFVISGLTGTVSNIQMLSDGFLARKDYVRGTSEDYIDAMKAFLTNFANRNFFIEYAKDEYKYGYNQGYSSGYNTGYSEGQTGENAISPVWNVLTGIFNSIGAILSIELIPHIPIGLLIFVPLFFIMVMAILSIWRKNW